MPMKGSICLVRVSVLLMVVLRASGALAAWVVNERGECVRAWTPASLVRGPAAMLNAPLLPLRSAVGGVLVARDDRSPGMKGKILLPPMLGVVPVRPPFLLDARRPLRESADRCGRRTGPDAS